MSPNPVRSLPKITVVTPSFNQGDFLERTILSVLDQKYPQLEYIIMDGGSTDQSVEIIKKYQKHLIWKSEQDHGQAHAINKGLKIATGDVLAYLNSDDTYQPKALQTVGKYFQTHPSAQFVYGRGRLIDKDNKEIGFYNDSQTDHQKLFTQCAISQPTAFWTREVMQTVGLFDESFQFTMDYEYWMRVSEKFKLIYLEDKVLANTRIHDQAKTSAYTHKLHLDAIRACQLHYGKVHDDWISVLSDGEIPQWKGDSFVDRTVYLLYMLIKPTYYHLKFNHEFPLRKSRQQMKQRMREYLSLLKG